MPKLKSDYLEKTRIAQGVIAKWLANRGLKKSDFGKALGGQMQYGYQRYNEPERLTVGDLRNMRLTAEELVELVGTK